VPCHLTPEDTPEILGLVLVPSWLGMLRVLLREGPLGFVRVCREFGLCVAWEGAWGCGERSRGRTGGEIIMG